MVMLNARIDDELKKRVDPTLQAIDCTATQAISGLWHYIDQHGRLPFFMESRTYTPEDALIGLLTHLQSAGYLLTVSGERMAAGEDARKNRLAGCTALTALQKLVQDDLHRVQFGRDGEHLVTYLKTPAGEAYLALTVCINILGNEANDHNQAMYLKRAQDFRTELGALEKRMGEMGLYQHEPAVRSYHAVGQHCAAEIFQPESYEHGAWQVRVTLKPGKKGSEPGEPYWYGLPFPAIPGRIFNPGTPYSIPVTGKHGTEIGFKFVEGISFFHMYSNGMPEEQNENSAEMVTTLLCHHVDEILAGFNAS